MKRPRSNAFRGNAKITDEQVVRLCRCFCQATSVRDTAQYLGVSQKTARSLFIALRARLQKPRFNRWHRLEDLSVDVPPEVGEQRRKTFQQTAAQCAANTTCYRNFRLGNRKSRECRSCPIVPYTSAETRWVLFEQIDMMHQFYEFLGIRGEKDIDPANLFDLRFRHFRTIMTVQLSSKSLKNGQFDPEDLSSHSGSRLVMELLIDLVEDPL